MHPNSSMFFTGSAAGDRALGDAFMLMCIGSLIVAVGVNWIIRIVGEALDGRRLRRIRKLGDYLHYICGDGR